MSYDGFDLSGKVAVITGGNGGIGLGFARAVAAAGTDVSVWGTNAEKNAAAEAELQAINPSALATLCDVADEATVEQSMAGAIQRYGRIDAASPTPASAPRTPSPFTNTATRTGTRPSTSTLHGVFYTLRAATKQMVAQGEGGTLVLTASGRAIQGAARGQAYAATKGGMIAMMLALSVEMARYKITANAIIPGWVETGMTECLFAWEKFVGNVMPRIPMRRWGTPDDFGAIAVYLMSDVSRWHNGDVINIDGGFSIF